MNSLLANSLEAVTPMRTVSLYAFISIVQDQKGW
jgi:hypothetical protein